MSNKDFYRAFEEKYYAPRTVIKELRKQYLPFVEQLIQHYPFGQTYDLGCGRGEWLELMQELGLSSYGVDLDDGMLQGCRDLGLPAEKGDAVSYLKTLASESHLVISAFHVVEHISFEDLQNVVQEALRVLKPGGLLIMETPNPENIKVATENFYLDPTHIKPIPSKLLSFLPEFYGYNRTKILRLQESKELAFQKNVNLLQVIEGTSPDYAVVAQKDASADVLEKFDELFKQDFGLPLSTLAYRFENRLQNIEARVSEAEARVSEAEARVSEAEARVSEAEARAKNTWDNYHTVVNSNSWKITKPLRLIGQFARWFLWGLYHWFTFSPTSRPRRILNRKLIEIMHYINERPNFKSKVLNLLDNFPYLKVRLKRLGQSQIYIHPSDENNQPIVKYINLSPHAMKIYQDLKTSIAQRQRKAKQ